jgi:hypothetical protein
LLLDSLGVRGQYYPGGREALRDYIRDQFGAEAAAIVDAYTLVKSWISKSRVRPFPANRDEECASSHCAAEPPAILEPGDAD